MKSIADLTVEKLKEVICSTPEEIRWMEEGSRQIQEGKFATTERKRRQMRPEVHRRMEASDREEQMARQLLMSGFYEGCAFYCQQAAEKALKAALLAHGPQHARAVRKKQKVWRVKDGKDKDRYHHQWQSLLGAV